MKTFTQWLQAREDKIRTGLGIYPPQYAMHYPPSYYTPHSATAALSLQTIHKKDMEELMGKKKKKKPRKKKKSKKQK